MEAKTLWVGRDWTLKNCTFQFPHEPHPHPTDEMCYCPGIQGVAYSKRWKLYVTLHIARVDNERMMGFRVAYHSQPYITQDNVAGYLRKLGWEVEGKKWLLIKITHPNGERESFWMPAKQAVFEFRSQIASMYPDIGCAELFEYLRRNGDEWRAF
jgi:hypothetical protein